jgi:type IV secretion system protein VirB6
MSKIPNNTKRYFAATMIAFILCVSFFPLHQARAGLISGVTDKALEFVFSWLGNRIIEMAAFTAGIGGKILDLSIEVSIGAEAREFFDPVTGIAAVGWKISRDVANLFFIFILLIIGIGIILGVSSFGSREILVRLILIALLVNFSWPFTLIIIDISNIVAMEFLCAMTGGRCAAEEISVIFAKGFELPSNFVDKNTGMLSAAKLTPSKIIVATLGGTAILLTATFVFLALAVMFFLRTIVLIILTIFAPLAYLAMVLPATRNYASSWWNKLFSQAIIAPVSMFMLYLVAQFIVQNQISNILGTSAISFVNIFTDPAAFSTEGAALFAQFGILCGLLVGSILVSQKVGAYGAAGAISAGKRIGRGARGFAGRQIRKPVGKVAEKAVESKAAQRLARIPYAGRTVVRPAAAGLGKVAQARRTDIDKQATAYANYAPAALATIMPTLAPQVRKAVTQKLDENKLEKMSEKMTDKGKVAFGQKLMKQDKALGTKFAKSTKDISVGGQIIQDSGEDLKTATDRYVDSLNIGQLKKVGYKNLGKDEMAMQSFLEKTHQNDFNKIAHTSRQNMEGLSQAFGDFAKTKDVTKKEFVEKTVRTYNQDLGNYLNSSPGTKNIIMAPEKVPLEKGTDKPKAPQKPKGKTGFV